MLKRPATRLTAALLLVLPLLSAPRTARACTAFLLEGRGGGRVMAKSYDYGFGHGVLMVNPRGVAKQALPTSPGSHPASWVSRYASLTFNQYGREMPQGGMNEAGLMVEVLWLERSQLPPPDARPTVNELQWIQAQLDRFATIDEMVRAVDGLRVERVHGRVHYLACDRSGDCAAFEHVGGRMQVARGARVLTNHTHAASLDYLARARTRYTLGIDSLSRFARATQRLAEPLPATATGGERGAGDDLVARAFDGLEGVRWFRTQWQIVYDPVRLTVHFRTRGQRVARSVDLGRLLSSSATASACEAVRALDLETRVQPLPGRREVEVTGLLKAYDQASNRTLVARSLQRLGGRVPAGAVESLARYPESLRCAETSWAGSLDSRLPAAR
jgi:choloylglycine hydrolase